ncbi:gex interacting protein 10, partial [Aphelenchoides avenae]
PYAAPAVSKSQGSESRYDKLVNSMEERLWRSTALPMASRIATMRDFRKAPEPSAGSAAEAIQADDEMPYLPRPYYSRPDRRDPDYFDFDLQHSVDMFKRPEGRYRPRGPQPWENKLVSEARLKGDAPISGHMFTTGAANDWRAQNTSYLSSALRTPSFWEHRFSALGAQVRESNPISYASLLRNKPPASRFTEYRDPDFEDYEDPKARED